MYRWNWLWRTWKKLKYFKIPKDILDELKIEYPDFLLSANDNYLEINFGGTGETKEYPYDCNLICNSKNELEAINIEVH